MPEGAETQKHRSLLNAAAPVDPQLQQQQSKDAAPPAHGAETQQQQQQTILNVAVAVGPPPADFG